ncbi:MAG TPA: histidine kinase dimerization/phosphoacceptor domain -containing protein [Pseudolabrys sp.]|nr:histidine kinase dimerization/phosphoacceptor domain -containing protein [Pseudolabrys sp.]
MITRRLLVLVGAALLPALGIQAYSQYDLHRARDAEVRREVVRQASRLAAEQQHVIDSVHDVLVMLADLPPVRAQNASECQARLNSLRPRLPGYAAIIVTREDGSALCASDTEPQRAGAPQVGDRPFFQEAMRTGAFTVGNYTFGRRLHRAILPLALPYRNVAEERAGVVLAALDLEWLSKRLASLGWRPEEAFSIVDRDGLFLVRYPDHAHYVGTQVPRDMWEKMRTETAPGNFEVSSPLDDVDRIVGFVPPSLGPAGFYVGVGEGSATAFGYLNAVMWRGLTLLFIGLAVAMLLAWYFGDRLIRRPIGRLVAATQRWRGGDLSVRTGLSGDNEIGQLGASFDAMAADLERALEYKDVLLRELSHRVMNSLQTLSSLFTLQARSLRDPEARGQLDQAVRRLQSMALAYRRLHMANGRDVVDVAGFLDELSKDLNRSVMGGGQCTVEADPLLLSPDQAMPLALIVNELITNAIKHGTPNAPVTVKLGRSNGGCRLAVRNRGTLPIGYEPAAAPGFGMRMVLGMVKQLDGRLEASCMAEETEFAVTFKASLPQPATLSVVDGGASAGGPTAA